MSASRGRIAHLAVRTASRAFLRGSEHCSVWKSTLGPQFARSYGTEAAKEVVPKNGSRMKWFFASAAVGGGAAAAIALQDETSPFSRNVEGIRRAAIFWVTVLPIFTHYKYTQWRVKGEPDDVQDAAYNRLHERYAPVVEEISLRLKGFYLKNAQIMSTRDDFVPPAYLKLCKKFQDSVPTELSDAQVKAIVERELGCPISDVFSHFEFTPLGAASIGQVHRATLKEELTGEASGRLVFGESRPRDVVVKVMYPNIEERFRGDLRVLVNFCQLAMPQHTETMREIEKHFSSEMNYQVEAQNLCDVRSNLYRAGWASQVEVPEPVLPLCTRHILVMQYLPGVKLVDGVRERWRQVATARGLSLAELEEEHTRQIKEGKIKRRSAHVASVEAAFQKWVLRSKDLATNALRLTWNWSLPRLLLRCPPLEYKWTPVPINLGAVLDLLLHVHAHEIFVDGVFNGDPHPGNILLMPDGRLGLIDYGQVSGLIDCGQVSGLIDYGQVLGLIDYSQVSGLIDYGQVRACYLSISASGLLVFVYDSLGIISMHRLYGLVCQSTMAR
eukprot:jgi/Mesvir1/27743/Mv07434-RA.3